MKAISQLLLNFLVNAGWQVLLIAAVASVCAWLIRSLGPRQRQAMWVAALFMSLVLPLITCSWLVSRQQISPPVSPASAVQEVPPPILEPQRSPERSLEPSSIAVPATTDAPNRFIKVNGALATGLAALYLLFLLYRSFKLSNAWRRTRIIKRSAHPLEPNEQHEKIFAHCQAAIGVRRAQILCSASVSVPLTVGIWRPIVILPERLLRQIDADVLTSAVGHELVHVLRRDFLLNLVYELIYLPISFHPAAALVRRKINQTRELSCDELVAEKLLTAEVYAQSLVQLAGSAVPFGRHATLTVGITDADILEVRIMSLLRKPKLNTRRRKLSLIAATLLLAVPFVAATALGVRLDIKSPEVGGPAMPQSSSSLVQPSNFRAWEQDQEKAKERERREMAEKKRAESERKVEGRAEESEMRLEQQERALKEKEDAEARELKELDIAEHDSQFRELGARARQQLEETKAMLIAHTSLARMAKITMEQAIQIANSQYPGKVMECSLVGQGWESPGKLGKDGHALYHVVIISPDELNPAFTHVMVNALDGTIYKTWKEERRKEDSRAPISGGVLNGKAISMPAPEYPAIARAAQASGSVKVQVTVDEQGNVIAARAVGGHPLLQAASVNAARQAKFSPTLLTGEPVQVTGILIYNFVAQ